MDDSKLSPGDVPVAAGPSGTIGLHEQLDAIYRADSRRVFATLVRLLGDFDLAEEALHDAFRAALRAMAAGRCAGKSRAPGSFRPAGSRRSTRCGAVPGSMRRWQTRRATARSRSDARYPGKDSVEDDRLRLIFTCCHPALAPEAQVALTLREVCGLTTEEIASAFLIAPPTLAQRIVRAKAKIRDAGIPYEVPDRGELPERLDSVLQVIYLVFNEGYSASSGESLTRARSFGRGDSTGATAGGTAAGAGSMGLLALMLLHESRRAARPRRRAN